MSGRVDQICLALLFLWLLWIPLPFGSNVPSAKPLLIAVPLVLCAGAGLLRLRGPVWRTPESSWRVWTAGGFLLLLITLVQLVPMPGLMLRTISPSAWQLWSGAHTVGSLSGVVSSAQEWPMSVNPDATVREFFRMLALLATFQSAALLVTSTARRKVMAVVLTMACAFEACYGLRQGALQNYDIWGWHNSLIFDRVTGTFVNPNHFASYLLITMPFGLFLAAGAWKESFPGARLGLRIARLIERRAFLFSAGVLAAVAAVGGVLLAQSRGALLAGFVAAVALTALLLPSRRRRAVKMLRLIAGAGLGLLILSLFIVYLGSERTVARFQPLPSERVTLLGRRIGVGAAFGVWQRFPTFGSGAGTFGDVVSMAQDQDVGKLYHHAHNDYAEIAATTGATGFVIAVATLLGGTALLTRSIRRRMRSGPDSGSSRRAFQVAALGSLFIAITHSFIDFNFFIPANAATLAAIAGAAVSIRPPLRNEGDVTGRSRARRASPERASL